MDLVPYETHVGTCFLNFGQPAKYDATCCRRLRDAGALFIGKGKKNTGCLAFVSLFSLFFFNDFVLYISSN